MGPGGHMGIGHYRWANVGTWVLDIIDGPR